MEVLDVLHLYSSKNTTTDRKISKLVHLKMNLLQKNSQK